MLFLNRCVAPGRVNNPLVEVSHTGESALAGLFASARTVAGDAEHRPPGTWLAAQHPARVSVADAVSGVGHADDRVVGRGVARVAAACCH